MRPVGKGFMPTFRVHRAALNVADFSGKTWNRVNESATGMGAAIALLISTGGGMAGITRRQSMALLGTGVLTAFGPGLASAGSTDDLATISLSEAAARMRSRSLTSLQLTSAYLDRIQKMDPALNAMITVMSRSALAQAILLDAEAARGEFRSPLHGLPILLKDNIDTAGTRTTAGSAVFDDRVPTEDAEVCGRLKAAGAVILGKTNMEEFASGFNSVVSAFGPVHNPWNRDRIAGGSSGGSAAAVAAGFALAGIGTDTGGSVRVPSAYCGTVGLKPTYGLISCRGIVPLVPTLDTCGPIARSVEDIALLLNHMVGFDKLDPASVQAPPCDYVAAMDAPVTSFRVGVARAPFFDMLDPEVRAAVDTAIAVIRDFAAVTDDFVVPSTSTYPLSVFMAEHLSFQRALLRAAPGRYMTQFRKQFEAAEAALNDTTNQSCGDKLEDYFVSRRSLEIMRRTVDDAFNDVDLIVFPTTRQPPPTIKQALADLAQEPASPMLNFANNGPMNILGLPALSLPCGFTRDGMPIGLTIAGPHFSEGKILALAKRYQNATNWHRRRPSLRL